jgi:hypothetical protein
LTIYRDEGIEKKGFIDLSIENNYNYSDSQNEYNEYDFFHCLNLINSFSYNQDELDDLELKLYFDTFNRGF